MEETSMHVVYTTVVSTWGDLWLLPQEVIIKMGKRAQKSGILPCLDPNGNPVSSENNYRLMRLPICSLKRISVNILRFPILINSFSYSKLHPFLWQWMVQRWSQVHKEMDSLWLIKKVSIPSNAHQKLDVSGQRNLIVYKYQELDMKCFQFLPLF